MLAERRRRRRPISAQTPAGLKDANYRLGRGLGFGTTSLVDSRPFVRWGPPAIESGTKRKQSQLALLMGFTLRLAEWKTSKQLFTKPQTGLLSARGLSG